MTSPLRLTTAAERDVTDAFVWYEDRVVGLGMRFLGQLDALMLRIRETPRQFPEVVSGYRRALVHRFPYGVYFSLDHGEVVVHAVLHLHRKPASLRTRLTDDPA